MHNILVYLFILLAKIIEVSIGTLRLMLITRGERLIGAIISFFEICLWVFIASTVLNDLSNDPIKALIYAAGFSIGNYVGSMFEGKLALGTVKIEAIVMKKHGENLADAIREKGYAVTVVEAKGMNYDRNILYMIIKRKDCKAVCDMIRATEDNVVLTINDIKPVYGGYGFIRK
ncbi:MAG: DUF2179 domain-containing protein [Christensenellaceae bacterium]|nr:DUF2179 domain-containing protein [Christensenellaceae bacterium]